MITTQKMMMLLGNISTVQFLHCKALLLSMWQKHVYRISILEIYNQRRFFLCDFNLHFNFVMKDDLANHTPQWEKQVVSHLSSQPKGKVLFWLLVAERAEETHTKSYISLHNKPINWQLIVFEILYIIIDWPWLPLAPSIFPKKKKSHYSSCPKMKELCFSMGKFYGT